MAKPIISTGANITVQPIQSLPTPSVVGIQKIEHALGANTDMPKYLIKTKDSTYAYVDEKQLVLSNGKPV